MYACCKKTCNMCSPSLMEEYKETVDYENLTKNQFVTGFVDFVKE